MKSHTLIILACFGSLSLNIACSNESTTPETQPADTATQASYAAEYTTRGIIRQLPVEGSPASSLQIQHEAVPDFMSGGEVTGMQSMIMSFPVASKDLLSGLSVGNIIAFTFSVTYNGETHMPTEMNIIRISVLPADTELQLGMGEMPMDDHDEETSHEGHNH